MATKQNSFEGQDYGTALLSTLLSLANPNNTPLAAGARALGAASGTPVGQNPLPGAAQAALQLGPYQKGVEKALKEGGYAHAQEALQQGVPAQHIEQQSQVAQPQQAQQPQQMQQQAPQQQPGQQQQNPMASLLQFLVRPGGIDQAGHYQQRQMLGGLLQPGGAESLLAGQQAAQAGQMTQNLTPLAPGEQPGARLTPEQAATYQTQQRQNEAAVYGHQVTAAKDQVEAYKQAEQNVTNLIQQLAPMRSMMTKVGQNMGFGPGQNINAALTAFKQTHEKLGESIKRLEQISSVSPSNAPKKQSEGSLAPGNSFNGEAILSVKKVG